jgi:hypothetical protein
MNLVDAKEVLKVWGSQPASLGNWWWSTGGPAGFTVLFVTYNGPALDLYTVVLLHP